MLMYSNKLSWKSVTGLEPWKSVRQLYLLTEVICSELVAIWPYWGCNEWRASIYPKHNTEVGRVAGQWDRHLPISEWMKAIRMNPQESAKKSFWICLVLSIYLHICKGCNQNIGHHFDIVETVLKLLQSDDELPPKYRDHILTGNHRGFRECHILPDWLLIYKKDHNKLILISTRTGTHSDLFK